MQSEAIKLAKLQIKEKEKDRLFALIGNPVVIMIAGCAVVELLQYVSLGRTGWQFSFFEGIKPPEDQRLISQSLGTALEAGIILYGAGAPLSQLMSSLGGLAKLMPIGLLAGK